MAVFSLPLGNVLGSLQRGAQQYAYAAQTFLPNHPLAVAQQTGGTAGALSRILERGIEEWRRQDNSNYPRGRNEPPSAEDAPSPDGRGTPRIGSDGVFRWPWERDQDVRALNTPASWFDGQRIAFLIMGATFTAIGFVFILRNVGDIDLDKDLKRVQLRLGQRQLDMSAPPKKIKNAKTPKPASLPQPDARPDFGKRFAADVVEGSLIDAKVTKQPGFGRKHKSRSDD